MKTGHERAMAEDTVSWFQLVRGDGRNRTVVTSALYDAGIVGLFGNSEDLPRHRIKTSHARHGRTGRHGWPTREGRERGMTKEEIGTMTDDELRIALAEALGPGWREDNNLSADMSYNKPHWTPEWCKSHKAAYDLGQEMERRGLEIEYCRALRTVVWAIEGGAPNNLHVNGNMAFRLIQATPRQRAEAALLVLTAAQGEEG